VGWEGVDWVLDVGRLGWPTVPKGNGVGWLVIPNGERMTCVLEVPVLCCL
jgi:hypothetical protein